MAGVGDVMPLKEKAKRLCARLACCSGRRRRARKEKLVAPATVGREVELFDALWSPHLDTHCRSCLACYAARSLGQTSRECRGPPLPSHFTL